MAIDVMNPRKVWDDLPGASGHQAPTDQADGLRRLFGSRGTSFVPLVANAHVFDSGLAIERLTAGALRQGRKVLIVDAADRSPPVAEASALGLAHCIETLAPDVGYLAARGLPLRYVDTRGGAGRLLDELVLASAATDLVLLHAEAPDLARIFKGRAARPVLLAADHPESVKHAYAAWKLLATRCEWLSADLLLLADRKSPRAPHIAASLAQCADSFLGAVLTHWAAIDPDADPRQMIDPDLKRLLASQLDLDDLMPASTAPRSPAAAGAHSPTARH